MANTNAGNTGCYLCFCNLSGCDGIFIETHPDPKDAKSDVPNQVPLDKIESLIKKLMAIHSISRVDN